MPPIFLDVCCPGATGATFTLSCWLSSHQPPHEGLSVQHHWLQRSALMQISDHLSRSHAYHLCMNQTSVYIQVHVLFKFIRKIM